MKKLISLLCFVTLVIIYSCSGGSASGEKESSDKASEEVKNDKKGKGSGAIKDCDDFLDRYEEWITLYIEALKEYQQNPMDSKAMMKYTAAMSEASTWAQDWTKLHACAYNEKYQKRFEEIADEASKAMEELGFE